MNTPLNMMNRRASVQPITPHLNLDTHLNILVPSFTFGGAERMVHDLIVGLALQGRNPPINLFVLRDVVPAYPLPDLPNLRLFRLHDQPEHAKFRAIALEVQTSPAPTLFTHLVPVQSLRNLWNLGVQTVPVIHNSNPGWQDSPQNFTDGLVPFVVAVAEDVARQLRESRCTKPIVVLRHELPYWNNSDAMAQHRRAIRDQYGIRDDTLLIGMVGQFKAQKAYTRAVRVLSEVQQFSKAKLMILGGWDPGYGAGRAAFTATCQQALDLGVMPDLILPGVVHPVQPYFAAFDVFLNTSIYEGLSIALLEAIQAGCAVVSADAGGNREVLPEHGVLVQDSSDISAYVEGIRQTLQRTERTLPQPPTHPDLIPRLWSLLGRFATPDPGEAPNLRRGTLFVTDNINFGGPQRSLCNLLSHLRPCGPTYLAILNEVCRDEYLRDVERSPVLTLSLADATEAIDKVERLLHLIDHSNIRNVCFWNADARVKLLLAKVLELRKIKLIDVSPGPMYVEDFALTTALQNRICFGSQDYFARLDHFVAKYKGGVPSQYRLRTNQVSVIPNGVPLQYQSHEPETPSLLSGVHPDFVIATACRIAPSKRLEYLLEMMKVLAGRVPEAQLVVFGSVDPRHWDYWRSIVKKQQEFELTNVRFVGGHANVRSYLRKCKVFVMISEDQGCPNASLEAMAEGLPIITNRSGGTDEQVEDGVNGFLVSGENPSEMAESVELLLRNPKLLDAFGRASKRFAAEKFSMDKMAEAYARLLCPDKVTP